MLVRLYYDDKPTFEQMLAELGKWAIQRGMQATLQAMMTQLTRMLQSYQTSIRRSTA